VSQQRTSTARLVAAGLALALPLLGFGLLLAEPSLDLMWAHEPSHFWLVLTVAALSSLLAYGTGVAAQRRADVRVFVVSLAYLASAGFLGLHALATPGVLLEATNPGFAMATPVGLTLGAVFAALSCVDVPADRAQSALRAARTARWVLLATMAAWAVASLAKLPPLDGSRAVERASGPLVVLAVLAIGLYAVAALRYLVLGLRRRATMLLGMAAAFTLLGEAMVAVAFARSWHVSWWEWHVLMLAAFALVAWSAQQQWHEERFAELYLDDTLAGSRDMSVLFADLQGFTSYSETHSAGEVTAMLNTYFEQVVPVTVHRYGGEVDRLIGDAVLVTFNRRGDRPDHAERAAAAGLALQEAAAEVSRVHPDWPRFRVGINSGEVSVAVLGAAGGRTHTVIGDTVNTASRLEGKAPVGGVAISAETAARLAGARTQPLGLLELKGKTEPLQAFHLLGLDGADGGGGRS
jgi:class 3 adenylate cyclase